MQNAQAIKFKFQMRLRPNQQRTQRDSGASFFNDTPKEPRRIRHLVLSQGSHLHETHENYLMINQLQSQSTQKTNTSLATRLHILRSKMKSNANTFKSDSGWPDIENGRLLSNCTPVKSEKTQSFKIRELKKTLEDNRMLNQSNPNKSNGGRLRSTQRSCFAAKGVGEQKLISESFANRELTVNYNQLIYNIGRYTSGLKLEENLRQSVCPSSNYFNKNSQPTQHYMEPAFQSTLNVHQARKLTLPSTISSHSYSLQHVIGKGSYAVVYQAMDRSDKSAFAVKVYSKAKMASNTRRKIIENEIEVLKLISHENIIKLHKCVEDNAEIHLVLELVKGQSMGSWVKSFSNSSVSEQVAKPYLKKLLNAVAYLHSRNICHRDLKLDNVIITPDLDLKLIDFGFACVESGIPCLGLFCGTPNYMAPELVNKVPYKGFATDCWAFGVLFYRVIVGSFPFHSKNTNELKKNIAAMNFSVPKRVSQDARRVIEALLVLSPSERATMQQIKTFSFFT